MTGVVAVIATYRPPALDALVTSVRPQADAVVVADDASPATSDSVLRAVEGCVDLVRRFPANAGIARSLNAGLAEARRRDASWLLTLDQDSRPHDGYVDALLTVAESATGLGLRVGAVGAALIAGSASIMEIPAEPRNGTWVAEELVQAGTLWSVGALEAIGGFDEALGMDAVDAAAGIRLQRSGWSLLVAPGVALRHEIGDSRPVRVLGRTVQATSHGPERRESILRNRLRLAPEAAGVSAGYAARTVRRALMGAALAATVEDDRWAKAKGSFRALLPRRGK